MFFKVNISLVILLLFFVWCKVLIILNSMFLWGSFLLNMEFVKEFIGLMCVFCLIIGLDRLSISVEDLFMVGSGVLVWI